MDLSDFQSNLLQYNWLAFPLSFWAWANSTKFDKIRGVLCQNHYHRLKFAKLSRKSLILIHFHKICWTIFLKCCTNFVSSGYITCSKDVCWITSIGLQFCSFVMISKHTGIVIIFHSFMTNMDTFTHIIFFSFSLISLMSLPWPILGILFQDGE